MRVGFAICLMLVVACASIFGTPYGLQSWQCASYDPRECTDVISCTYYGVQGRRVIQPEWSPDMKPCDKVVFFPLDWPLPGWKS